MDVMDERFQVGTFRRPKDLSDLSDPAVLFGRSYLLTRTVVGVLGLALPLAFIIGEAYFLRSGVQVRGSISAYYHTAMRDLFVGGLCVIGFMLATYMSGQTRRTDFWLSLVSGVAVLGVAFFPTMRPGLSDGDPRCGSEPAPVGCSPIQQQLGETAVGVVHFTCAAVFILSLAVTCFYFAYLERRFENNPGMARLQRSCGGVILGAVAWVALGRVVDLRIGPLTALYVGEVAAVWAFAVSWLATGRDLWKRLFRRVVPGA